MKTLKMIAGKNKELSKSVFPVLVGLLLVVSSCNNNETVSDFSAEDTDNVQSNLSDDFSNDDADDAGMTALVSETSGGGRIQETDDRFQCATVTRIGSKTEGSIRIDFGDGCTDKRGNVRKGAILVDYSGRWNLTGSSWKTHFEDYSVNGVLIAGTRSVANITTDSTLLTFTVDLEDGTATWPDGRVARRRLHHKREHEIENHILQRLIIYGTAEGNHRNGRGYIIEILEPLVYDRRCAAEGVIIPVKGKKLIKHGDRQITVDYGDGRCDNIVTLINKNGRTKEIRVGN